MTTRVNSVLFGLILIAVIFIAGCDSVTMWQPLSADPQPIDREQFEGAWRLNGAASFNIRFGDDGLGRIAFLEWQDGEFLMRRGQMIVTEGKAHNFLSVRFEEDGQWSAYHLAQYRFTPQGELILWLPNIKIFEEAVEGDRLQGVIERGRRATNVMLTNEPAKILEFVDDPDNLTLFNYRNPIVMKKVAGVE